MNRMFEMIVKVRHYFQGYFVLKKVKYIVDHDLYVVEEPKGTRK